MKKLPTYSEQKLQHSAEYILQINSFSGTAIIILIAFIIATAIMCICFGKIDDVVRASGIIRPAINISQIKNITAGEIEQIYYSPGQYVEAGTILVKLNQDTLSAQKSAAAAHYTDTQSKLNGLEKLRQSYFAEKNLIPEGNKVAHTRFESYQAECNLLETKKNLAYLLYSEEIKLPASGTTPVKIRNLEYEHKQICDTLAVYKNQFLEEITAEISNMELTETQLKQQLEQIEISLRNTILVSPMAGFIQEISSLNAGDFIFADQKILNIIPNSNSDFRIELRIPAKDAGKLRKNMKVKLRFPAFPYYEFKGAEGTIQTIDPDAQASSSGTLFFTVLTDVDTYELTDRKGIIYPLRVGLEVDARIVMETKPIWYFLLKKMDILI
ncbi:HlyD family secretion protein [Treponema brennaborense]|uniref:Secretion protein HlyD family protein n=1 Tax=Treponema brennaborense (strain DSM 12168 / CIP 105900 / DD5/3) TaxID=906968 RepID=F4LKC0_TREBD|nr:HlyD family efflux transporter periplasmic adaptor subunit [Treponema brennaborense]AEE16494.1 secretion protein HlyD family protein [Treponema brennaborense DSM 12168]